MLSILTDDILPVFSMLALGFVLGRFGKVSRDEAAAVNRVAFLTLQPALIFPLIHGLDFNAFRADAIALYALCQVLVFGAALLVAYRLLRRSFAESWLLAMATVFVNTLLYIWPISFLIYGQAAALPITGIVAWDSAVTFAFFIISTDLLVNRQATALQSLRRVLQNPVLIAIGLGLLTHVIPLPVPAPLLTAMDFAGAGAAPLTLFALGVILSGHSLIPNPTVMVIAGIKLLAFPAAVWLAFSWGDFARWDALLVLTAAGPSGAMAFALAMLHGVRTDHIAPVIIWTSILSLLSLAWLA